MTDAALTGPTLDQLLRKLTPKQRRFLREVPKHRGQFWGALAKLGISSHTGHRWMREPRFAEAWALVEKQALDEVGITAQRVLREQAAIAFSDVRELYDANGNLKSPHEWPDDVARSISGVEVESLYEGRGEAREFVGTLRKVKRWDKGKALEQLSRYLGMLNDVDAPANIGPGLTVIVQTGGATTAVQAGPGVQGRVVVDLPGPE